MKKLKIFYLGERLKDVYPHATRFQVFKYKARMAFKRFIRLSIVGTLGYMTFMAGAWLNPITSVAYVDKVIEVETVSPVLERIAKCESGGSHYKNGQVVINKTQDIGKYQINVPIWGKKATEMGLNLAIEKDNETFALYLYKNFGTEPWVHSKTCWNK